MAKPQPKKVLSDNCPVTIGGEVCFPHEGETVTLFPGWCVGELEDYQELKRLGELMSSGRGNEEAVKRADEVLEDLCRLIAHRLVSWDWKDKAGRPLPPLDGTPKPLKLLSSEELIWLMTAGEGDANQAKPSESEAA